MKKISTLALALGIASAAFAQGAPDSEIYYRLITGSISDSGRPNTCMGTRDVSGTTFFGMATPYAEGDNTQLWRLVANADGTYAMVTAAGQYFPELATAFFSTTAGTLKQNTRFEPQPYEGEIPAEAYGFDVTVQGELTEVDIIDTPQYNQEITRILPGDTYISIRPLHFRNNLQDFESVAENETLYLDLAGGGRQTVINLWELGSNVLKTDQTWILVPEHRVTLGGVEVVDGKINLGMAEQTVSLSLTTNVANGAIMYKFTPATEAGEETPAEQSEEEDAFIEYTEPFTVSENGTLTYYVASGEFESQPESVEFYNGAVSSINTIEAAGNGADVRMFDMLGRPVAQPRHGVFVTSQGRKVIL